MVWDIIGCHNWGTIEPLEVPQTVEWSDAGVTRDSKSTIKMSFKIAGSDISG